MKVLSTLERNKCCMSLKLFLERSEDCAKQKLFPCKEFGIMCKEVRALQRGWNTDFVRKQFVLKAYFNVNSSDVFNILIRRFIFHVLSSVHLLYVRDEDLKVGYTVKTRGHLERWLYFLCQHNPLKTKLKHYETNAVFSICFLNISGNNWICSLLYTYTILVSVWQ